MSVETFAPQFTNTVQLPDDVECTLKQILIDYTHIDGHDLEASIHNPGDAFARICNVLHMLYFNFSESIDNQADTMAPNHPVFKVATKYLGNNRSNALVFRTVHKMHHYSKRPVIHYYELACNLHEADPDYEDSDASAVLTVQEDNAKLQIIHHDGIDQSELIKINTFTPSNPHAASKIYSHLITLSSYYIVEPKQLDVLPASLTRELGRRTNLILR